MTVINLRVTRAEMNAIEVGLDTIIDQLTQPYEKDNRQKLIMALEAQEAVECADENNEGCISTDYVIERLKEVVRVNGFYTSLYSGVNNLISELENPND